MTGSRRDLFAVAPDEFVAARDQLARELRAAGDKDEAAAVKRLRRPPVPVWALNQVVRSDPDAITELLASSEGARAAQNDVLEGADADVLRAALARRRNAMGAVARSARRIVDESGRSGDAQVRDIENALQAIVGSEPLAAELGRGELAGLDADEKTDGDLFADLASSIPSPAMRDRRPRRGASPPPRAPSPPSRRLVNAREKLERHRGEAAEAAEGMRVAERAVKDAEAAAKRLDQEVAVARRARDVARQAAERADAAVVRSEEAVARLEDRA
jgi:hypothetical protein